MKKTLIAILCSVLLYSVFYYQTFLPNVFIGGSDAWKFFYPSRFHLYQSLIKGEFPFWTEKIFSGYPIYADLERGFLNPLNILSVLMFGPFTSYKVLHFSFFLIGSLFLYMYLKKINRAGLQSFLAANAVLFFSNFNLYHQQHFGLTLICSLFPVFLYLTHEYCSRPTSKYVLYLSLITALMFYIGNIQAAILVVLPALIYFLIYKNHEVTLRIYLKHSLLFLVFTFALISPQLFPTHELYLQSSRSLQKDIFVQGSFMPMSFINIFYPSIFGLGKEYKWNTVSSEFFIHETYVYVGIVTLILGLLGFTQITGSKKKLFIYILTATFIILSTWGYIPLLNKIPLPLFSMFRYWGRSAFLFNIALAMCLIEFFSSSLKFNLKILIKPLFILVTCLFAIQLFNFDNPAVSMPLRLLIGGGFKIDSVFYMWLGFFLAIFVSAFFVKKYRGIILVFIILDLFIFGKPVVNNYLRTLDSLYLQHTTVPTAVRRVGYDNSWFWNLNLYSSNMGILGYSQFIPKNYLNTLATAGIKDSEILKPTTDTTLFTSPLISNTNVTNFDIRAGAVKFNILVDARTSVQTFIRNYPGWELKINDKTQTFSNNSTDTYLSFKIDKGNNYVEMLFVPKSFYTGVIVAFSLLVVVFALYLVGRLKLNE